MVILNGGPSASANARGYPNTGSIQRTHGVEDALQALLHRVGADAAEARLKHRLLNLLGGGGGGGERDGERALGGLLPVVGAGLAVQLLGLVVVGPGDFVEALDVPMLRVWACTTDGEMEH